MKRPSAQHPTVETQISCEKTNGYDVKRGTHYYEQCPFCGHSTDEGDDHEIVVTILE